MCLGAGLLYLRCRVPLAYLAELQILVHMVWSRSEGLIL